MSQVFLVKTTPRSGAVIDVRRAGRSLDGLRRSLAGSSEVPTAPPARVTDESYAFPGWTQAEMRVSWSGRVRLSDLRSSAERCRILGTHNARGMRPPNMRLVLRGIVLICASLPIAVGLSAEQRAR